MNPTASAAVRSAARKSHRVAVVVVAVVAILIALAGTVHFVVQAWEWSIASVLHGAVTFGSIAACLVLSRIALRHEERTPLHEL